MLLQVNVIKMTKDEAIYHFEAKLLLRM